MCFQFCTLRVHVTFMTKNFVYENNSIVSIFSNNRVKNCGLSSEVISAVLPKLHSTCFRGTLCWFFPNNNVIFTSCEYDGKKSYLLTIFQRGCQNCLLHVQRNNSRNNNFFPEKKINFRAFAENEGKFFGLFPNNFGWVVTFSLSRETFWDWKIFASTLNFFGGLPYMHSKCPNETSEENCF